jgi:hypothetical protein
MGFWGLKDEDGGECGDFSSLKAWNGDSYGGFSIWMTKMVVVMEVSGDSIDWVSFINGKGLIDTVKKHEGPIWEKKDKELNGRIK